MKSDINPNFLVMDDDGYTWYWDGQRIYALDVDDPDCYIDVPFVRKGYSAETWEKALHWLAVDGYISEEMEKELLHE
jgi:hypothetical protein